MYEFKEFEPAYAETVVKWNEGKNADFLMQWAGKGFTYPITKEQVMTDASDVSSAAFVVLYQGKMIGTIAIITVDEKTGAGYLGHYLLSPEVVGKGHGTAIMREFIQFCFGVLKLKELSLRVFDYNIGAIHCYEKNGLEEWERTTTEDGLGVLLMGIKKKKVLSTTDTQIEICDETEADWYASELVTQRAFWNLHFPGCDEHLLVSKLRKSEDYVAPISKIAKLDGQVVGIIMYSKAYVISPNGTKHDVLTFGPLSVEPNAQSLGIGGKLLKATIEDARKAGYPAIIIFGEPYYYPRFGFQTCDHFGITTPDGKNFDAFMAYELQPGALSKIKGKFYESEIFENLPAEEATKLNQNFPPLVKYHLPGQWN